ncbi:MAG: hypothetical protein KTR27_18080 [Leptolyngbyaceae cyanobacterium MAG.088]|nr:hypothetical protein [Leptolyngbyaceae cyanobacterium MAG.088]
MSLDEFQQYYSEAMGNALNQLQRVTLLSSNLNESVEEINASLRQLNRVTEQFINAQSQNPDESSDSEA